MSRADTVRASLNTECRLACWLLLNARRLARRLPRHNGYKTLGAGATGGALAQPHPSCCPLYEDADGLLPEFLLYHELVQTSKPFLRQVGAYPV